MQISDVILISLAVIAVLAHVATRMNVPYPILMVVAGAAISIIPGLPVWNLRPDMVFLVVLPPILYYAGILTSWRDFRLNLRPIVMLAVGLVLFTMLVVAWVAHAMIPGMNWPSALALGAIVSPPDAVAAAAIFHRLRVPKRIITILEGESLVNDATALVALKFAVIAAGMTTTIQPFEVVGQFFLLGLGGMAVGFAVGMLAGWLRPRTLDPVVENILSLMTPYAAYLPAEHLHVSGVLSVVTCGLVMSRRIPKIVGFRTRLRAVAIWETLIFLLNGLVFIAIGLQLPQVVADIGDIEPTRLYWYAFVMALVTILSRLAWLIPATYVPRMVWPALRRRDPAPPFGHVAIIGWAGMRGIVSLACALGLAMDFPQRSLIVFLTFVVILATLVLQGLTLPGVIRFFGLTEDDSEYREERTARLESAHAALARLAALNFENGVPADVAERVTARYEERVRRLAPRADGGFDADLPLHPPTKDTELELELMTAERKMLTLLRDEDVIGDDVLRRITRELDLREEQLFEAQGHSHA